MTPTHTLQISEGSQGIFLCNETNHPLSTVDFYPETNLQKLDATFEDQSFIRYWWDGEGINAADVWANYDSLVMVYNVTQVITGLHFQDCNAILKTEEFYSTVKSDDNTSREKDVQRYPKEAFEKVEQYHQYKRDNFMIQGVSAIGTVSYDMINFKVTGSDPKYVEFDVTIKDDLGSKYLQTGAVRIWYDSFVFGDTIVASNQVTVTRGSMNQDTTCYIDPIAQDHTGSSIFIVASETFNSQCKTQILTTPQTFLHVKIEMPNCVPASTVELVDTAMPNIPSIPSIVTFWTGYSNTASDPNYYEYSNLVHNDIESINYCGASISNFYPQTVAGGIKDSIIIEGSQFGNLRGSSRIYMKNADDGGTSEVWLDNLDYISWTDTLIKAYVPSYDSSLVAGTLELDQAAGSGNFRITSSDGSVATSAFPLTIDYSVMNHKTKQPLALAPWSSMNQSIIFRCDTTVANYQNGAMKAVIKKALEDWACLTGINWTLGADIAYSANTPQLDSVCIIHFRTLNNALARTSLYRWTCPTIPASIEMDISIDSTNLWYCDTLNTNFPTTNHYDFYSVILHELGHAHGLSHIINTNRIMHFNIGKNVVRRNLEFDASCDMGGNWMIDYTTDPNHQISICGLSSITANPNPPCTHIGIFEESKNELDIHAYPNPFGNEIYIRVNEIAIEDVSLTLTDIHGRVIFKKAYSLSRNGEEMRLETGQLDAGVYIIQIETKTHGSSSLKMIKHE